MKQQNDSDFHILVVEDSETSTLLIQSFWADEEGYTLDFADNVKTALELVEKKKPDLVVLDLMLPVSDGFQFLETVRKTPKNKDIPVVVVSAKDDTKSMRRAKALGVIEYIVKPIGINKFYEKVTHIIEQL